MRKTKEVRSDRCWAWLQDGFYKRETQRLIVAAQNHSIRTNESIDYIISGCSKRTQKKYKKTHDNL